MFGADYLVRMKNPAGSFYITVSGRGPEKKPEDRLIIAQGGTAHHPDPGDQRQVPRLRPGKDQRRRRLRGRLTGKARDCASPPWPWPRRSMSPGDFAGADYLKAAEDAFAFLEKNNLRFRQRRQGEHPRRLLRPDGRHRALPGDEKARLQGRRGQAGREPRWPG